MCNKQCGAMTHQETTDRINALAYALGALNDAPRKVIGSSADKDPVKQAIDAVASQLITITNNPINLDPAKAEKKTIGEHVRQTRTTPQD